MMLTVNCIVKSSLEAEPHQIVESINKYLTCIQDKLNLACYYCFFIKCADIVAEQVLFVLGQESCQLQIKRQRSRSLSYAVLCAMQKQTQNQKSQIYYKAGPFLQ